MLTIKCKHTPATSTRNKSQKTVNNKNLEVFSLRSTPQRSLSHLHHARFLVQRAEDRLPPLNPVGRLPGAPASFQLANVAPRPHARLPVLQAAQLSPGLKGRSLWALLPPGSIGVAVLVVHVEHARLGVALAEAPPCLAPVPERWVLVAERAFAGQGGVAVAAATRAAAAARRGAPLGLGRQRCCRVCCRASGTARERADDELCGRHLFIGRARRPLGVATVLMILDR